MLKYKISKIEDVAEQFRGLYTQGQDGAFYLAVDGAVGKDKLDEFRNNNIDLMKQLEAFKGVDPSKIHDLLETERKVAEKKLIDAGDIDGLVNSRVNTMRTEYEGKLSTLTKQYEVANRQLETLLVDNEVRAWAAKVGVAPTAVDDVLLRAKTVFRVEDGKPVAKDAQGNVIYGRDGVNTLSVGDWIGGLKDNAPHLFMQPTGSGATNQRPGTGGGNAPKTAVSKISAGLQSGNSIAIQS